MPFPIDGSGQPLFSPELTSSHTGQVPINEDSEEHCFWQASDSVCTTVLTETLSNKKRSRFAHFLCCTVHNRLENDLETNNKQTNVIDLTMRTLVMHTNTHTHTHTRCACVRVCVGVCVCACVGGCAWAVMSAPPFFQSAGRGDLNFWGEDDGPTVVVWESLSESEQEHSPGRKDGQVEVLGGLVQLKEKRRRATSV